MKWLMYTVMSALFLTTAAVLPRGGIAGVAEDEAAIREIWIHYQTARVNADSELWLSLWDEEGIQMLPDRNPVTKAMLDAIIPKVFQPGMVTTMQIDPEEIVVAGEWAYTRGQYSSDRIVEGKDTHIEGKFMTILKIQPDGSWKIYRDIMNANPQ